MKKHFQEKVDLRNRRAMIDFLAGHFRYDTMNSWNASTSYAHRVKIHRLGLSEKQLKKAWSLIEAVDLGDMLGTPMIDFAERHNYEYQMAFNGRSGGYIVLIQGGKRLSDYKSYCIACGQRNFKTTEETGKVCGRCGKQTRVDYSKPPIETFTYPGRSLDMGTDFTEWSIDELRNRVRLVQDFDKAVDQVRANFIYLIRKGKITTCYRKVPYTRIEVN